MHCTFRLPQMSLDLLRSASQINSRKIRRVLDTKSTLAFHYACSSYLVFTIAMVDWAL